MKMVEDKGTLAVVELYLLAEEDMGWLEGPPDVC